MPKDDFLESLIGGGTAEDKIRDVVSNFDLEDQKLAPLLDEISIIQNPDIRGFVRAILYAVDHFWSAPASASVEDHPLDEAAEGGLVLHTKRVIRTVLLLAESQLRSSEEIDLLLAAALLHDVTKMNPDYDYMHPYTVDGLVEQISIRDELDPSSYDRSGTKGLLADPETLVVLMRLIRCHEGAASPIPETLPVTQMEWILHWANIIASNLDNLVDGRDIKGWRWKEPNAKRPNSKTIKEEMVDPEPAPAAT